MIWDKIGSFLSKLAIGSNQKLEWMDISKFERIKSVPMEEVLFAQKISLK